MGFVCRFIGVGGGFDVDDGGGLDGARVGASRSSSSEEEVSGSDIILTKPTLPNPNTSPVLLFGVGLPPVLSLLSVTALSNPAAALVFAFTPCNPINPVIPFLGLFTMNRCSCVPCHGASCPSFGSKSLSELSPSSFRFKFFLAPDVRSLIPCFILSPRASASIFFLVSFRISVRPSTGLEISFIVEALRSRASFFNRTYSAWCKCAVNVRATERNSSSTIM